MDVKVKWRIYFNWYILQPLRRGICHSTIFERQEYYRKRVWNSCQLIVGGFFLQPRKSEMISLVVSRVEALCVKTLLLLQNQTWNKKSVAKLYFSKSILTATIFLRFDVASKAFWNCSIGERTHFGIDAKLLSAMRKNWFVHVFRRKRGRAL